MNEKIDIERGTAEGFLKLYNQYYETSFEIDEISDSPDVRCIDESGERLNIEITMTEDESGTIQAFLGRSSKLSLYTLKEQNKRTSEGLEAPRFHTIETSYEVLVERINSKLQKDYGSNAALVIRDVSGMDWEWETIVDRLSDNINLSINPFSKGIWLLSFRGEKLFRLIGKTHGTTT